ncbi:hypothetical protein ACSFA0_22650 [Variovorax sp. LT1P1]|uniref:hypothetical protein n=1 Tax=Variovorax sp. LT1P1 TaxID=3443730 RepID=UPI003F4565FC
MPMPELQVEHSAANVAPPARQVPSAQHFEDALRAIIAMDWRAGDDGKRYGAAAKVAWKAIDPSIIFDDIDYASHALTARRPHATAPALAGYVAPAHLASMQSGKYASIQLHDKPSGDRTLALYPALDTDWAAQ